MGNGSGDAFPPVRLIKALDGYTEPGTVPILIVTESKERPTVARVGLPLDEEWVNEEFRSWERQDFNGSEESTYQRNGTTDGRSTLDRRWVVESVVCGDGSVFGDKRLMKGKIYGSCQARCAHENLHPIEWDKGIFKGYGECAIRFPTYSIRNRARSSPITICSIPHREEMRATRRRLTISREQVVADAVLSFLMRNPGTVVIITRIGARGPSHGLASLHAVAEGPLMARGNDWCCVKASIINAVRALCGSEAATRTCNVLKKDSTFFKDFKPLGQLIHKLKLKTTIKKIGKRDKGRLRNANREAFRWLSEKSTGVWLVRLVQDCVVDHCIVVDAARRLIYDSAEMYPVPLTEKALLLCGGESASKLRIQDIRELAEA